MGHVSIMYDSKKAVPQTWKVLLGLSKTLRSRCKSWLASSSDWWIKACGHSWSNVLESRAKIKLLAELGRSDNMCGGEWTVKDSGSFSTNDQRNGFVEMLTVYVLLRMLPDLLSSFSSGAFTFIVTLIIHGKYYECLIQVSFTANYPLVRYTIKFW